jgi:hypothetical protein
MEDDQQLNKDILQKIESGKVTMRSRASFTWKTMLWILAFCLLAAAVVFIVSFVVFILRANGNWDLPKFGLHGLVEFLTFFPWLFVPALLLFLWLLEHFILRHSLAYRLPVLYSGGTIILIVVLASLAVLATPLHHRLFEQAQQQQLPIAGGIYRFFGQSRPDDFYVGAVASTTPDSYTIITPAGQKLIINKTATTQIISGSPIVAGDCLEILGDEGPGGRLVAASIKKTDANVVEDCRLLPPPPVNHVIILVPNNN